MPKAVLDSLAVKLDQGKCRVDVFLDTWDTQLLPRLKSVPAKSIGGKDPSIAGYCRAGKVRAGVYIPLFDEMLEKMKKAT